MQAGEAILASGFMGVIGILLMWIFFHHLLRFLVRSLCSPIRLSHTIEGQSHCRMGWRFSGSHATAYRMGGCNRRDRHYGGSLFTIQFMWQFPHFWSIAWVAFEDYAKADFYLLPASTGRDKRSAVQVVLYTVLLIGVSTLPFLLGYTGIVSLIITLAAGLLFLLQAIRLWQTCSTRWPDN